MSISSARFVKPLTIAELQQLQALVLRPREPLQMLTPGRQRLRLSLAAARPSIERMIKFLKKELRDCEAEVAADVLARSALPCCLPSCLSSASSTGDCIAALVGVAPLNSDSGQMRGQRHLGWAGQCAANPVHGPLTAVPRNPALKA